VFIVVKIVVDKIVHLREHGTTKHGGRVARR
jgi:hypothetical protein